MAAQAEEGVIVAGNLASALAADPAKRPAAVPKLAAAIDDWVAYDEELARLASAEAPLNRACGWTRRRGANRLGG